MTYICRDCGCKFERPYAYQECVGEFWGVPAYETFGVCPDCKSCDWDEEDVVLEEMEDGDFDEELE